MKDLNAFREFQEAIRLLRLWHRWHNLELPRVVLVYDNKGDDYAATNMYRAELREMFETQQAVSGGPYRIEGMAFTFTHQEPRY